MVPALPLGDKGVISVHRGGHNCPQLISTAYTYHPRGHLAHQPPWPKVVSTILGATELGLSPMQIRCGILWMYSIAVRPLIQIRAASQKGDEPLPPGHSTNALIIYSLVQITSRPVALINSTRIQSARGDNGMSYVASFPSCSIRNSYFESLFFFFFFLTFKIRTIMERLFSMDDRILFRPERHLSTSRDSNTAFRIHSKIFPRIVVRRDYAKRNVSLNDITPRL